MLDGLKIFITGGSRGLGRAFARVFGSYGALVAFSYSSSEDQANKALGELKENGVEALAYRGSVSDEEAMDGICSDIEDRWGGIDVLVNNAAISQPLPFPLIDPEDWEQVLNTNLTGLFLTSRVFLRGMIRKKRGVILNIGSLVGERIMESPLHYSTSKAALSGFTRSLAKEMGRYNIRVNCLAPGLLDDGLGKNLSEHKVRDYMEHTVFGRLVTCDEVAELAAFLVSPMNEYMTGHTMIIDGGI